MKNKLLKLLYLSLVVFGLSNIYISSAKAVEIQNPTPVPTISPTSEITEVTTIAPTEAPTEAPEVTPIVNQIAITQLPSKTNYYKGEELDLTGMVVEGYYPDGTSGIITEYSVTGYYSDQIGSQTVMVFYQNQIAVFTVTVMPAKVMNISTFYHDMTTLSLTWDAVPGVVRYEVYLLDDITGTYNLLSYTDSNYISTNYTPGTIHSYKICTVEYILGIEYRSEMSDVFTAATNPETVTNLTVKETGTNFVSLSWDPVFGATGYLIYRSTASANDYVLCGITDDITYKNNKLISGKSYNYKVCAYSYDENYTGDFSNVVDTSTNPNKVIMKYKAGDGKVRLTWSKVNGATAYDIYMGDSINGFVLLTSLPGKSNTYSYIAEGLTIGDTYTFYTIARRDYKGFSYQNISFNMYDVEMKEIAPTSAKGKLFPTEKDFLNSWSYKSLTFFSTYVDYAKSYAIPGLTTTNVGGFSSTTMCPQGLTFAGNYVLMSAYDLKSEENSVIYVLGKKSKKLLTTLILPSKPHVGGLAFDGVNVWVTNSSKVSSILFSDIDAAARSKAPYTYVNFNSVSPLGITTSYLTYYDNKLWVGTYNELQATYLYSYTIDNKDVAPTLTKVDTMVMPTRVQGLAFTSKGTLILSRSCQLYKGLRGYMRQLDVYKPLFTQPVDGVIPLGELVNSVSMPSMNEGIAINGSYLYVTFESGAFEKSTYKMDRICAFRINDVTKKKAIK